MSLEISRLEKNKHNTDDDKFFIFVLLLGDL